MTKYLVILFYKFTKIEDPDKLVEEVREICTALNLKGRLLIAHEGVNGTFEGEEKNVIEFEKKFRKIKGFEDIVFKESKGIGGAFSKLEVKTRSEVVTLGVGNLDIKKDTAKRITADELQKLYEKDEDFVVLDLRNDFEIQVGRFDKTYNPNLRNFRDLPDKLTGLDELKDKKVIAVCTGGIRCEKATPLLKNSGFKDLYQLEDGIHTYMQKYPNEHFKGTLFVFDNRMTTSIVDGRREVIGKCAFCSAPCEDFYNDDSIRPSRKVLCCSVCYPDHLNTLRTVNQFVN